MAIKEYEVTLRLRVEDENPANWGWRTLLEMSGDEGVEIKSCILVGKPQRVHPETEEWLPETDDEGVDL